MKPLPNTNIVAKLTFKDRASADLFAKMYTRKSLMGHTVSKNTVTIYNVDNDMKAWINDYISND